MMRLVPPAGTPVSLGLLGRIIAQGVFSPDSEDELSAALRQKFVAGHIYLVNSGRTALTIILKAMARLAGEKRDEVIIPAYTCFSVPAAVARSGLKIRPVDIDSRTLDYDYEKLAGQDFSRVLAVLAVSLFGLPNDWDNLHRMTGENGIGIIDDAAQSMGATFKGRFRGTLGEAGFFSLGRGKNLSAYSGGIIMTDRRDLAEIISEEVGCLDYPSLAESLTAAGKLGLSVLFAHPRLYWIPASLPFLGIGETIYDPKFPMARMRPVSGAALSVLLPRLEEIIEGRRKVAGRLAAGITEAGVYTVPGYTGSDYPVGPRLPVIAPGRQKRDEAVRLLRRIGISASPMYPSPITAIDGMTGHLVISGDDYKGAQVVAGRLLTVPTHSFMTAGDIDKVVTCLSA